MKTLFAILLVFASHRVGFAQKKSQSPSDALYLFDLWVAAQQEYDKLPGVTVGIVKDQDVLWSKGYGMADMKKNVAATPASIYSICSISKLFTSIAIMQLYEAGKLRLDDSVAMHLPDFKIRQQYKESGPITIRGLLTHSSGLPRESDYPYWTGPDFPFPTSKQVSDRLDEQQTLYPSSKYFQYSNLGMTLLGDIVERISGQPYEQYVTDHILKPLRLANTRPSLPAELWGTKMATGYGAMKRDGGRDPVGLFDARGITAAAGFSSNVDDLARFASWQFRLLDKGGKEILQASTLREMQRVQWTDPDWKLNWGLGFQVRQVEGKTVVGHGGSCPGYRTTLMLVPEEKMAFIAMINAGGESPEKFASQARAIFQKAAKEKAPRTDSLRLQQYVGRFNSQPWGSELHVVSWYGKLAMVSFPSDTPADGMTLLKYAADNSFHRVRSDDTLGEEIRFERDASGKVKAMWWHSNSYRKME